MSNDISGTLTLPKKEDCEKMAYDLEQTLLQGGFERKYPTSPDMKARTSYGFVKHDSIIVRLANADAFDYEGGHAHISFSKSNPKVDIVIPERDSQHLLASEIDLAATIGTVLVHRIAKKL